MRHVADEQSFLGGRARDERCVATVLFLMSSAAVRGPSRRSHQLGGHCLVLRSTPSSLGHTHRLPTLGAHLPRCSSRQLRCTVQMIKKYSACQHSKLLNMTGGVFHLHNSIAVDDRSARMMSPRRTGVEVPPSPNNNGWSGEGVAAPVATPTRSDGRANRLQRQGSEFDDPGRIKVFIRVRPQIKEDSLDAATCVKCKSDKKTVVLSRQTYDDREFRFDRILTTQSSQENTYEQVAAPLVDDVLKGYNGTLMAYGQTGTGKTYTIFGSSGYWGSATCFPSQRGEKGKANSNLSSAPKSETSSQVSGENSSDGMSDQQPSISSFGDGKGGSVDRPPSTVSTFDEAGIIPRAVSQIFGQLDDAREDTEFRITLSFLQIYMESITDLLNKSKNNLAIREDPKSGIFVEGLTQLVVQSPQEVLSYIKEGAENRATQQTMMNKTSSRSHVILMLSIEQRSFNDAAESPGECPTLVKEQKVKRGVLTLVDLAGSERVAKSGSEGMRLEEAKKINKSLSALGNCVAALTDPHSSHVPFRDSKLTRLLTVSLGGNSKTFLCANVGPASYNYDETYSTLLFATRAMGVKNHAVINEVVTEFQASPGGHDGERLDGSSPTGGMELALEPRYLLERNHILEQEVASMKAQIAALQSMQNVKPKTPTPSDNANSEESSAAWAAREKELVAKYTDVILHLQMEIAKQNFVQATRNLCGLDPVIEQLCDGLISIPGIKAKLLSKLSESVMLDLSNIKTGDSVQNVGTEQAGQSSVAAPIATTINTSAPVSFHRSIDILKNPTVSQPQAQSPKSPRYNKDSILLHTSDVPLHSAPTLLHPVPTRNSGSPQESLGSEDSRSQTNSHEHVALLHRNYLASLGSGPE